MASLSLLMLFPFLSLLILSFTSFTSVADPTYYCRFCSNTATFTTNSVYKSNIKLLLSSLTSGATQGNGFYNTTVGEEPNKVYGSFLCRGDVNNSICQDCVTFASRDVTQNCPVEIETIIWYDECLLRYSNQPFFSVMEEYPGLYMCNPQNYTDIDWFDEPLWYLTHRAVGEAANSSKKFSTGKENFASRNNNVTGYQTLYVLLQCTLDLSILDCDACLRDAIANLADCSSKKLGGRVLFPSCNFRYELYPFFNEDWYRQLTPAPALLSPPPTPVLLFPPTAPAPETRPKGNGMRAVWIATSTAVSAIIIVVLFASSLWLKRRRNKEEEAKRSRAVQLLRLEVGRAEDGYSSYDILRGEKQMESQEFPLIPLDLILEATQHFSDKNKLGQGGFGPVYKGILADGKEIAVKRLSRTSGQGLEEFKNEVILISKLQHKNLVRLLGCCFDGNELLLIYDYMPNKSLDLHLFDSTRGVQLDWNQRLGIINGIVRGLLYLHEDSRLRIIHRDLKTSNVLLDHEKNPKISDFGMARIFGGNQSEANTKRVVGTYGYMAPEYAMQGIFSIKSDVFSFGVVLLEIVSGRKNTGFYLSGHGRSLLAYAWKLWCEGQALELVDPLLVQSSDPGLVLKFIHIGLLCVQEDPIDRPTMSSVVVMLVTDSIALPKPTQPAFSVSRDAVRAAQCLSDDQACSVNEVTVSNFSPR